MPENRARASDVLPDAASTTALSTVIMKGAMQIAEAAAAPTSTAASAQNGMAAFSALERAGAAGPLPPIAGTVRRRTAGYCVGLSPAQDAVGFLPPSYMK